MTELYGLHTAAMIKAAKDAIKKAALAAAKAGA